MTTPPPTLSVIVVSYNTRELTLECLRTVQARLGGLSAEVIVVDNASADGSAGAVAAEFPGVQVIANAANVGFGAANNAAMRAARGRYFLLLNSDAFPHAGCLPALVGFLEAHPEAGMAGPRLVNADGSLQRSCWPFPSPGRSWLEALGLAGWLLDDYRRWGHDAERVVDFVIGACLLVRREVHEQIGGFDERFFLYQEETDWQLRCREWGWQVMFTPAGTATHLAGGSGREDVPGINRVFFESLDRYMIKHFGGVGFVVNRGAQIVGAALRMGCWMMFNRWPTRRWRERAQREERRQREFLWRHLRTGWPD